MQLLNIDPENELQVVGMVIVTILLGVALASVEWESKAGAGESRWG